MNQQERFDLVLRLERENADKQIEYELRSAKQKTLEDMINLSTRIIADQSSVAILAYMYSAIK